VNVVQTTILPGLEIGSDCSMLGLQSDSALEAFEVDVQKYPDAQVWGPGMYGDEASITFSYTSLYFKSWIACKEHFEDHQTDPTGTCMTMAKQLKNTAVAGATSNPARGCKPDINSTDLLHVPPLTSDTPSTLLSDGRTKFVRQGFNMWGSAFADRAGWWTGHTDPTKQIDASFNCEAKFAEHFCASGAFAKAAVAGICDKKFLDTPPFSCNKQVPKYKIQEVVSLAWSNVGMLWSTMLAILVIVLRRLPGANNSTAPEHADSAVVANPPEKRVV
jgi:hypothetical protein